MIPSPTASGIGITAGIPSTAVVTARPVVVATIVAAIGAVVIAAVIAAIVPVVVAAVEPIVFHPVEAPVPLEYLNLFKAGAESIVVAIIAAVIVDHHDPGPPVEIPEPSVTRFAISIPNHLDPDSSRPVIPIAAVVASISNPDVAGNRSASDSDIGLNALRAGGVG